MAIHVKNPGLLIGLLFAVAVCVAIAFALKSCDRNKSDKEQLEEMLEAYKDSTKYWRNEAGQEVATRRIVEGSLANMKNFFTKEDMEELEQRFDVKFKDLKALVRVASKTETIIQPAGESKIEYRDTSSPCPQFKSMAQRFAGKFYDLSVKVGDGAYAHLQAWDTLTLVAKDTTIGRLFNRKTYSVINVVNANPDVRNTITGAYMVKKDQRVNSFELSAKGGWRLIRGDSDNSLPFAGVEGQYNLGRFSATGSYNKLIGGGNQYFWEVGGRFTILKF